MMSNSMDDIDLEKEWSRCRHLFMDYDKHSLPSLCDPELVKLFEALGLIKVLKNVTANGLEIIITITPMGLTTE